LPGAGTGRESGLGDKADGAGQVEKWSGWDDKGGRYCVIRAQYKWTIFKKEVEMVSLKMKRMFFSRSFKSGAEKRRPGVKDKFCFAAQPISLGCSGCVHAEKEQDDPEYQRYCGNCTRVRRPDKDTVADKKGKK